MAVQSLPQSSNGNLKPLFANDGPTSGNPTIPALARGVVENTMIAFSNDNLSHVCDFVDEMRKNIELKKFLKAVADQLRESIRAIMAALGLEPTGQYSWLIDQLKTAARWLRRVQKEILQPILDFEQYVLAYITRIRALIQWILELPAKMLALLTDCLNRFLKLVRNVFNDFFELLDIDTGLGEVVAAGKELATEAYKTVNLASQIAVGAVAIVGSATVGLITPVSAAELAAANKTISNYTSTIPTAESVATANAPKQQNKSAP